MASPAVALPNGVPEPAHPRDVDMTDAQSTSIKRKREPSINGVAHDAKPQPTTNGDSHSPENSEAVIRDYLVVLEGYVSSIRVHLIQFIITFGAATGMLTSRFPL
jgi:hypothetical protein